jgi:C-terminal processing protease CtpA/Prc
MPAGKRYWDIQEQGTDPERMQANTALMDYAVGTINTMYYDNSAGTLFMPKVFYTAWRIWLNQGAGDETLINRHGAVEGMHWLVGQLNDPFSKYLTREELREELVSSSDGFLGLGAIVEPPGQAFFGNRSPLAVPTNLPIPEQLGGTKNPVLLSGIQIQHLPVVTALAPDSPAERAGLSVGDRIVAVGTDSFLGYSADKVAARLSEKYQAENYMGHPDLTIAKPVYASAAVGGMDEGTSDRDVVVAYRKTHVRLATSIAAAAQRYTTVGAHVAGGDNIVHYELLTSQDSIFDRTIASSSNKVGYIRLTRFSRASTKGFVNAIQELENAGATSFIIDLRNNYGGVIQEAMLTASTLLRDSHSVLCYTMNSRGGFTPHDVEEYATDDRYPGYLLSQESQGATIDQIHRENPAIFADGGVNWVPPSSYASLREQTMKRGIRRASLSTSDSSASSSLAERTRRHQLEAQKNVVLLINEGTASSAEVFASALHDNGRTVALIGTKTFGKGLVQHTFPMPDGGGLRLTVAEYLTPALHHVTKVGGAQFDQVTGAFVGGGIRPDILCESSSGIPGNIGADWCVGVALETLEEADTVRQMNQLPGQFAIKRVGGLEDGTRIRRAVSAGVDRPGLLSD